MNSFLLDLFLLKDSDGTIDFREFLIGLSLLTKPANADDQLQIAFSLFDKSCQGKITLNDFQLILYTNFKVSPEESKSLFNKIDTDKDTFISFGKQIFYF